MRRANLHKRGGRAAPDKEPLVSPDSLRRSDGATKTEDANAAEAELVAYYRPIGIAAIAAAFALR